MGKKRILAIGLEQDGVLIKGYPIRVSAQLPQDCFLLQYVVSNTGQFAVFIETEWIEEGYPSQKYHFELYMTGVVIPDGRVYSGTIVPQPGLAYHVYEVLPPGVTMGLSKYEVN